uniref:Uncharacterized protein n=1 Tax=Anguilla anguilla TaxID=7936 RepID=A0A0E9TFL1_ANGAN
MDLIQLKRTRDSETTAQRPFLLKLNYSYGSLMQHFTCNKHHLDFF